MVSEDVRLFLVNNQFMFVFFCSVSVVRFEALDLVFANQQQWIPGKWNLVIVQFSRRVWPRVRTLISLSYGFIGLGRFVISHLLQTQTVRGNHSFFSPFRK